MKFLIIPALLMAGACGQHNEHAAGEEKQDSTVVEQQTKVEVIYEEDAVSGTEGTVTFRGYVGGLFEVVVDGKTYADIEDFYTQELAALPEKVRQAGFSSDYKITFAAETGFSDLWNQMTVYISPTASRGFQGISKPDRDGAFAISLPAVADGGDYKVRANKRISIILENDEESISICYNFSAIEKSVELKDSDLPVVLTSFESRVTSYACSGRTSSGVSIPGPTRTQKSYGKLKKGMSKKEVLTALSDEYLLIDSDSRWCWNKGSGKAPVCSVYSSSICQCSVTFDEEGKLTSQSNIKSEYLDILSF